MSQEFPREGRVVVVELLPVAAVGRADVPRVVARGTVVVAVAAAARREAEAALVAGAMVAGDDLVDGGLVRGAGAGMDVLPRMAAVRAAEAAVGTGDGRVLGVRAGHGFLLFVAEEWRKAPPESVRVHFVTGSYVAALISGEYIVYT